MNKRKHDYENMSETRRYNMSMAMTAEIDKDQYKNDAKKFSDKFVTDESVKAMVDEVEVSEKLSKFDFGDITEFLNSLDQLTLLEAVSYKKKIDEEIKRWKTCHSLIGAIDSMRKDEDLDQDLMKINTLKSYEFEDMGEFSDHYEENLDKLQQISHKLIEIVNGHKGEMEKTSFMTNEMIQLLRKRQARLDSSNPEVKKISAQIEAFENRTSSVALAQRLVAAFPANRKKLKKLYQEDTQLIQRGGIPAHLRDLNTKFTENTVSKFVHVLDESEYTLTEIWFLTYYLNKFIQKDSMDGRNIWPKLFILNHVDVWNKIFDLESGDSYIEKARNAILGVIDYELETVLGINTTKKVFGTKSGKLFNLEDPKENPKEEPDLTTLEKKADEENNESATPSSNESNVDEMPNDESPLEETSTEEGNTLEEGGTDDAGEGSNS